jgi:Cu2+-exporting ATPase
VTTAGNATLAAQIGEVLNQTQSYKDTLITRGRQVADRFVPVVFGLTAVTFPLLGAKSALAVTWSALGETMAGSGPLSLLSYLQILSQHSILVKDGRVFESLRQVDTIVFDKTGTLTLEQPTVGQIHALSGFTAETVLRYAAAAEYRQPHPVARAILAKAQDAGLELPEIDEASYDVGYGITVEVDGFSVRVGSARFLQREGIEFPAAVEAIQQEAEAESHSLIYVGLGSQLAGILEMQPTLRPEVPQVVQFLQQRGIQLYIISGDHEAPTRKMAERLGIEHYFAETLPENKAARVQELRDAGRFVCFIGDGINDAIALKAAQVSISLKGASTAATDTAQIIFMDSTLKRLPHLFQLADEFEGTMRRNLALSIVPGSITIGGVYLLHFGVAASMGIFYVGAVAALGNTLWPLVKHQQHEHP